MTWKADLYNTPDGHHLLCASKRDGVQMPGGPSSCFLCHDSSLTTLSRTPSEESLEAAFHIRQRATPMRPSQARAPYFSFLRLVLAICLSIIYPLTHFREQGTVMQLNSRKHKQERLPLHISFAKQTNALLRPLQGTRLFGISVKRYLLFVFFQHNFSGVGTWGPLWFPLTVGLG